METDSLPHHLSEVTFRKYEQLIAEGVSNFPLPTTFSAPASGKPNLTTFCARFRDSLTSLRRYKWSSSKINLQRFEEIGDAIVVRLVPETNSVLFTSRRAYNPAAPVQATVTSPDHHVVRKQSAQPQGYADAIPAAQLNSAMLLEVTPHELEAFCLLLSNRRMVGPVQFIGRVEANELSRLMTSYDVGISFHEPSNTTTLI